MGVGSTALPTGGYMRQKPVDLYLKILDLLAVGRSWREIRELLSCSDSQISRAKAYQDGRNRGVQLVMEDTPVSDTPITSSQESGEVEVEVTTAPVLRHSCQLESAGRCTLTDELCTIPTNHHEECKDYISWSGIVDVESDEASQLAKNIEYHPVRGTRFLSLTASDIHRMLHYKLPRYIRKQLLDMLELF